MQKKSKPSSQTMKNEPQVNLATLYSKCWQHAIDGSNRIMLPSEWRGEGTPTRYFVIVADGDEHLVVCPPAVFENFLAAYNPQTGATARQQTGSSYTRSENVNFMADEALIA